MLDRALSILVHAESKVGKTTWGLTGPYPRLLLDVEAASRFVPNAKIYWDPMTEAPPEADGTWDTCVVRVSDYDVVLKAYEWLKSGKHPFNTVILDSISELQSKVQESVAGRKKMQTQDWGELLAKLAYFCRDMRDLTTNKVKPLEAVVIIAMSRTVDGVVKPYLQGQIASLVPYWYDLTAYLYVEQVQDPATGEWRTIRRLLTDKNPNFEAGNRIPGLPMIIDNPNIENILDNVFGGKTPIPVATTPEAVPEPVADSTPAGPPGPPSN